MACEGNGSVSVDKFVVLRGCHKTVCDVETENQLNPTHFRAEPTSGNFASVVDIFYDGMIPLQRGRHVNLL